MKSLDFPGAHLKIGADQSEYHTIHAIPMGGEQHEVIAIYELTDEEVEQIVKSKKLYYSRWTFGTPFQPMKISATPIEINIQLKHDNGKESTHVAKVTENGIEIDGYQHVGNGEYRKIETS